MDRNDILDLSKVFNLKSGSIFSKKPEFEAVYKKKKRD